MHILSFEEFWRFEGFVNHPFFELFFIALGPLEALWDSRWTDFGRLRSQFWSPSVTQERFGMTLKIIDFIL